MKETGGDGDGMKGKTGGGGRTRVRRQGREDRTTVERGEKEKEISPPRSFLKVGAYGLYPTLMTKCHYRTTKRVSAWVVLIRRSE